MARPRKETVTEYVGFNFKLIPRNAEKFNECYRRSGCRSKTQFLMVIISNFERLKKLQDLDDGMFHEVLRHRNLLSKIANNLNQIAKQVNISGYAATDEEIKASLKEVENLIPEIRETSKELHRKSNRLLKKLW